MLILPELALACCAIFFAATGPVFRPRPQLPSLFALLAGVLLLVIGAFALPERGSIFPGHEFSEFTQVCKFFLLFVLAVALWAGHNQPGIAARLRPGYYCLLFVYVFALVMQISANDLGLLFAALVTAILTQSLLILFRDGRDAAHIPLEAASKTLFFGLATAGLSFFGMSLLFGISGTSDFLGIAAALHGVSGLPPLVLLALLLTCTGFFAQLALFPFHFWLPDACQGSANEGFPILGSLSGIAATTALIRLLNLLPAELPVSPGYVLGGLGLCSLFFGSLAALGTQDFKRFLAYLSTGQAGLVVFALMPLHKDGFAIALFTAGTSQIALLAAYLPLMGLARHGENLKLGDLRGLAHEQPLLACALTAAFFSLAGLPPLVGFMARLMVFTEALNRGQAVLVVLACLATVPAIAASLRILRLIYAKAEKDAEAQPMAPFALLATGMVLTFLLLLPGLFPAKIQALCASAVAGL